jgi:site-specific DNA-methyltransferase (adenine-specific)
MVDEKKNEALEAEGEYRTAVEEAYDYVENFDILETITNVGNDEVFTPRKTADMMLDSLPEEVWHNPNYKWLNPATKNGIFEREIAIRLDKGLEEVIPNVEQRRKHILQNMIYSIGQTKFTSNVARRTVYYCSQANRQCDGLKAPDGHYVNGYAIGNGSWFEDEEGNIKTPCTDHLFKKGDRVMPSNCSEDEKKKYECVFCHIKGNSQYNDMNQREKYAYEFIHYHHLNVLKKLQDRFFGGDRNMKFDIIIGNPPYQLNDGGGTGSSGGAIYHYFVNQAKALNPKYLCMIIPTRWFTGGKGKDLPEFRTSMIADKHITLMHDFLSASQCFPSNSIEGGVCYFLRERDREDECDIYTHQNDGSITHSKRYLGSDTQTDILVRNEMALSILETVTKTKFISFDTIVSSRNPFKLGDPTEICDLENTGNKRVLGYFERQRSYRWLKPGEDVPSGAQYIGKYKLFVSKADGAAGQIGNPVPARIMGKAELGLPDDVCSETYLVVGPFESKTIAENAQAYMKTKFFRFMVGIRKNKNMPKETYKSAPIVDFSKKWSDIELYTYFGLSENQVKYIEDYIQELD